MFSQKVFNLKPFIQEVVWSFGVCTCGLRVHCDLVHFTFSLRASRFNFRNPTQHCFLWKFSLEVKFQQVSSKLKSEVIF